VTDVTAMRIVKFLADDSDFEREAALPRCWQRKPAETGTRSNPIKVRRCEREIIGVETDAQVNEIDARSETPG
jgi:hypothetical protein